METDLVSIDGLEDLKKALDWADTVVIGAGAGLSTSAGFLYDGERFEKYFGDFGQKYGFYDMYSGGFYPYKNLNEKWAFWSRNIFINRYMKAPKPVYEKLYELVKDKNYFVLTTNVDHCFQKAGFDKDRLFYTQGDYGLFQCSEPCHDKTYDNEKLVRKMLEAQGFEVGEDLTLPEGETAKMEVPSELIPRCPVCGKPMEMNLRADATFVEDIGWYKASQRFTDFLEKVDGENVLFLELGVGFNTPSIIKYNFWQMAEGYDKAVYACINKGETLIPPQLSSRSIAVDADIGEVLNQL